MAECLWRIHSPCVLWYKKSECFRSDIKVTRASSEGRDDDNMYYLTENLQSGTTYYWRVDAEIDNKISYRGAVSSFQTKSPRIIRMKLWIQYVTMLCMHGFLSLMRIEVVDDLVMPLSS